jgi:hypothetical protein
MGASERMEILHEEGTVQRIKHGDMMIYNMICHHIGTHMRLFALSNSSCPLSTVAPSYIVLYVQVVSLWIFLLKSCTAFCFGRLVGEEEGGVIR